MSFYFGIDGGGTQTRAVIVDHTGTVRGQGHAGPSNYHSVGLDTARDAILVAQNEAIARAALNPSTRFDAICLGLAGCGSEEDRLKLAPLAAVLNVATPQHVRFESDLRIAHAGAFEDEPGIVLIAGTGSSCLGVDAKGNIARAGGWGPMFDDRGSGFDIGRMAIRHALFVADGREEPTTFSMNVVKELGGDLRTIARMTAAGEDRTRIASLAPLVFEAGALREPRASAIIRSAVEELAHMVDAVAKRLDFTGCEVEIVVLGGLNHAGRAFFQELYDAIRRRLPLASIVSDMLPPALGAALLAIKHAGVTVADAMLRAMKQSHQAQPALKRPESSAASAQQTGVNY